MELLLMCIGMIIVLWWCRLDLFLGGTYKSIEKTNDMMSSNLSNGITKKVDRESMLNKGC